MKAILRSSFLALAIVALTVPVNAGPWEDGGAAYQRGDYATALKIWRPLAEQGHAAAQHNFGIIYRSGQGVPQDDVEAVKWYRRAAEQGFAEAQFQVGEMYRKGEGVPKDYAEAAKWFDMAAAKDNGRAQDGFLAMGHNSAAAYNTGDYATALLIWRLLAERGYLDSQFRLGVMYSGGNGVPQDYIIAYMWFDIAASQGYDHKVAKARRVITAGKMTPEQIAETQRLARDWTAKHQQ